ncbi:MAG: putative DNA-invertase from lambdoid prophage Rac [bacterium ADurb.Bin429]|nr:MAG: putative DNA-invertase from lambdoid prophage Rac [bacterium ADurb.Bin429]
MINCALYCRVSTLEQSENGVSLDAQEERLRAYATLAGLQVVAHLREEGVSGRTPISHRPCGKELLKLLRAGQVQHILALKLDRLFRDAEDALRMTREWDKANVTLHILDLGGQMVNTASAMGRMMLTVIAGMAELERSLIAERTAAALQHKKAHLQVYSPTPLGYQREGDRLIPDPEEQALIARIRELHDAGASLRAIAATLNAEGIAGKNGGRWYAATVKKVLGNELHG